MRLSKTEFMIELPENWVTSAGSRLSASAVVSTTRVVGVCAAAGIAAERPPNGSSARTTASTILSPETVACGASDEPKAGRKAAGCMGDTSRGWGEYMARCKNSQQDCAA